MRHWHLLFLLLFLTVLPAAVSGAYTVSAVWGGSSSDLFTTPADVAVDAAGNVYVADPGTNHIVKLGPDGEQTLVFDSAPDGSHTAHHVAAGADGRIYVIGDSDQVLRFAPDGTFEIAFPSKGSPGAFTSLMDVAVTRSGTLLIAGSNYEWPFYPMGEAVEKYGVSEYSSDGTFIRQFGTGTNSDAFIGKHQNLFIDVALDGSILVANKLDRTVYRYGSDHELRSSFLLPEFAPNYDDIWGITIGISNDIFVTGHAENVTRTSGTIMRYDLNGTFIESHQDLAKQGLGDSFLHSGGCSVDPAGILYVADAYGGRVIKFSPAPDEPVTPTITATPTLPPTITPTITRTITPTMTPTVAPGSTGPRFGSRRYVVGTVPRNPPNGISVGTGTGSTGTRGRTAVGTGVATGVKPPAGRFVRWSPAARWKTGLR